MIRVCPHALTVTYITYYYYEPLHLLLPISPYTCAKAHMLVNRNVYVRHILSSTSPHCPRAFVPLRVKLYALWFFSETVKK
jgi:hypothetical protein